MGRPAGYQWQPLGLDSDPVPGDPARIGQEARHLASVATQITHQVAALRKISSDGTECGKHADKIRSSSKDLADQLDKVVGRYQKVSSALNGWIPELEQAQKMSIQALNQAEGPSQKLNQTVALPSGPNLTDQQKQDVQKYHTAMKQAQSELNAAQALLNKATSLRDSAGRHCADLINRACDDGMRDHHSFWGSITGFFSHAFHWVTSHWSEIVADACTVLEVVATILAVAAFIIAQFFPGLDILIDGLVASLVAGLVAGSMVTTGAALVGRILLVATHHGSWMDVIIDAGALATFGLGRLAGAAAKAMVPTVEAASKGALTSELLDAVATGGPRAAGLARFAAMEGTDSLSMAMKVGQLAPDLANGAKLGGFAKFMMNIGGFGKEEEEAYATIMKLGTRFTTPLSDLSHYTRIGNVLAGVTGIGTGAAGLAGVSALALNGWSTPNVGSWDPLHTHNWYETHFVKPLSTEIEEPAGASAGG